MATPKPPASSIRPTTTPTQTVQPTPIITPTNSYPGSGSGNASSNYGGYSTPPISSYYKPNPGMSTPNPGSSYGGQPTTGSPTPNPTSSTPPPTQNTGDGYNPDWRNQALRDGKDVNAPEFERMRAIEADISSRNEDLARQQEEAAIQGAERMYGAEMGLLSAQKGDIGNLARSQREAMLGRKDLYDKDFDTEKEKGLREVDKQKAEATEQQQYGMEQLGRAWKDMTREVQANMRARGIQDSQFAMSAEGNVTKDFNVGMRNLQTNYTKVFDTLVQTVSDVNEFYASQKAKLAFETETKVSEIDNWERGQITLIQGQENMSLARKLNAIQEATVKAQALRVQTANAIDQNKLALESWLFQFNKQVQTDVEMAAYKNSLSQSAANIVKTADALQDMEKTVRNSAWSGDAQSGYKTYALGLPLPIGAVKAKEEEDRLEAIKANKSNSLFGSIIGGGFGTNNNETTY